MPNRETEPTTYRNPEITGRFHVLERSIEQLFNSMSKTEVNHSIDTKEVKATVNQVKDFLTAEEYQKNTELIHELKQLFDFVTRATDMTLIQAAEDFNTKRNFAKERLQKQFENFKKIDDASHLALGRLENNAVGAPTQDATELFEDLHLLVLETGIIDPEDSKKIVDSYLQMRSQLEEVQKNELLALQQIIEVYGMIESRLNEYQTSI